ncbi:MAG: 4Fe-4S dicluster domain-containing protein [Planctomycetes bacterium]|nr:4Fe-4S dicluster domain-containing protein [Planctomycetota bacterium]
MTTTITPETPRAELPMVPPRHDAGIDYELFLDCVHCGLCTSACPTYVELGDENDSPRGRIYLMRAVTDGRIELDASVQKHLDLCLDCRACESACPSGVQYGKLIEPFRIHMQETGTKPDTLSWLQKLMLYHFTPYAGRMRLALAPARFLQWTGLDRMMRALGLFYLMPSSMRQMHEMLPPLKAHYGSLPEVLPAEGRRRARVALFTGCAADAIYPATNVATARVLQKNGCEVWIPRDQGCCGALHYHAALEEPAKQFAQANCDVFLGSAAGSVDDVDAIIVNAAGCGAMLKDYGHLFHDAPTAEKAATFARKVKDISEFLVELGPIKPAHPLKLKATYHDACHLCHGQQIRKQPRQLLEMIPEMELVTLAESEICCGAAGSYNLTQPEMAERLGERKAKNVLDTGADAVFSGNVGCLIQLGRYLRAQKPNVMIAHPIDALWASYTGEPLWPAFRSGNEPQMNADERG